MAAKAEERPLIETATNVQFREHSVVREHYT